MLSLARLNDRQEAWLNLGNVENIRDGCYLILTGPGKVTALRSQGCLIEPQIGDRVLVVVNGPEAYVLEVLQREQTRQPIPLVIDGDANLTVKGDFNLQTQNMDLTGAEKIQVKTAKMSLECLHGFLGFRYFSVVGGTLQRQLKKLQTTVRNMETDAERVLSRFQRHYRRITGFEDNRVGQVMTWVKNSFNLNAKNTSIQAEESVKIDADQIHLG